MAPPPPTLAAHAAPTSMPDVAGAPTTMTMVGPAGWLRDRAGDRALSRPRPSLEDALVGIGGAVAALGITTFAAGRLADSNLISFLICAVVAGGAIFLLLRGPEALHPAAVAVSGLTVPAAITFLVAGGAELNLTIAGIVSAAALLALYLVSPAPGHTFHLTMAVIALWLVFVGVAGHTPGFSGGLPSIDSIFSLGGAISLVAGALFIAGGWWLDTNGLRAMATPFLGVGLLAAALGLFAIGGEHGAIVGGLLAIVLGAGLCVAAAGGDRRGTLWTGAAFIGAGIFSIATDLAPDGDTGTVTALIAVVLGGALAWFGPTLAARADEVGPPARSEPE